MRSSSLTRSVGSILFAAAALSFCTIADAQDYKIKLNRPTRVGDEMTVHITTKFKQVVSANPAGPDEYTVELRGTNKALAVNEKTGSVTKLSCTVAKLTRNDAELYPAGTVIVGEKVGKVDTFTIDGNPVDAANVPALSTVIELNAPDRDDTDDALYGTDQRQKVGATWSINAGKIAEDLAAEGLPVPAESLKGEVKLVDVGKVNQIDTMNMNTHISADGFKATVPGAAVSDGELDLNVDSVIPVDESKQGLSMKMKMHLSMTVTPNNAPGAGAVTVTIDRETTGEQEPVMK
jgi:hypothetical protein